MIFRIILAVVLTLLTLIRGYYYGLARLAGGKVVYRESRLQMGIQGFFGVGGMLALVVYLLRPGWLAWANLLLPDWLRWLGAGLLAAAVAAMGWVHHALGQNFSPVLHICENHTLVTGGPYRRVRHPMYTAFFMAVAGWFLLSANWLVGFLWAGLAGLTMRRVKYEEAVMLEIFGLRYREYMEQTGRFWPRWGYRR